MNLKHEILEERKRISREIHDGVSQNLSYIIMRLNYILDNLRSEEKINLYDLENNLEELVTISQETYARLKVYLSELRLPCILKDSLKECIKAVCENFTKVSNIHIDKDINIDEDELNQHLKYQILRIIQEALHNVTKHANASTVNLKCIKENTYFKVIIEDNGKGFDDKKIKEMGFGLQIMKERAKTLGGKLDVKTQPNKGTEVIVLIPLSMRRNNDEHKHFTGR